MTKSMRMSLKLLLLNSRTCEIKTKYKYTDVLLTFFINDYYPCDKYSLFYNMVMMMIMMMMTLTIMMMIDADDNDDDGVGDNDDDYYDHHEDDDDDSMMMIR